MIHDLKTKIELLNGAIFIIGMSRRTGPSGSYKRTLHDATTANITAEINWINANRPPTDGRGGYHLNNPFAHVTGLHLTRSERVAKSVRRIKDKLDGFPSVVRFSAIVNRKDIQKGTDLILVPSPVVEPSPTLEKEPIPMDDDFSISIDSTPSYDSTPEPVQLELFPDKPDTSDYSKPITPIIGDTRDIFDYPNTPDREENDGADDNDSPDPTPIDIIPEVHDHLFNLPTESVEPPPIDRIFSNNPYAEMVERMSRRPLVSKPPVQCPTEPPLVLKVEEEEEEVTSLWEKYRSLMINGGLLILLFLAIVLWWIFSHK